MFLLIILGLGVWSTSGDEKVALVTSLGGACTALLGMSLTEVKERDREMRSADRDRSVALRDSAISQISRIGEFSEAADLPVARRYAAVVCVAAYTVEEYERVCSIIDVEDKSLRSSLNEVANHCLGKSISWGDRQVDNALDLVRG